MSDLYISDNANALQVENWKIIFLRYQLAGVIY